MPLHILYSLGFQVIYEPECVVYTPNRTLSDNLRTCVGWRLCPFPVRNSYKRLLTQKRLEKHLEERKENIVDLSTRHPLLASY